MRVRVGHVVVAVVCIAAVAAGCTQQSAGDAGSAAASGSSPSPGSTGSPSAQRSRSAGPTRSHSPHPTGTASGRRSAHPTGTAHRTGTAHPTGTADPTPPSGRARLSCGGTTVDRPGGAPYCFDRPFGFRNATRARLGSARWVTAVGLDAHDAIAAGVFRAPTNTDTLPDRDLRAANDLVVRRELAPSIRLRSTTGRALRVDGARALEYHGVPRSAPTTQIDYFFVFRGHTKLQINCEWSARGPAVRKGCSRLLNSLQLISLG